VVPKPLPTLHPDRYSPGSTPPAANLKPGAADRNNPTTVTSPPPSTSTQPAPQSPPAKTRKPANQPDSAQPQLTTNN
jgi:rod shape-determining protein MreC